MERRLEKNRLFRNTSRKMHCKLEQKSLQNKSKIFDCQKFKSEILSRKFFCMRLLFQLKVYIFVFLYRKLPIYIENLRYIL